MNIAKKFRSYDDWYMPNAGQVETANCGICNEVMEVKRGLRRHFKYSGEPYPESDPDAYYDNFVCPNSGAMWHNQLKDLWQELDNTSCRRIAELISEDIEEILLKKQTTLKGGKYYEA